MTIAGLRQEVKDALEGAGVRAFAFLPERINPPVAIIGAGSPYIEPGETYCDYTIRLEVTLVAQTATNEVLTEALDALIEQAVIALDGWDFDEVMQPFTLVVANANYLATRVLVSNTFQLGGS